MFEPYSLPNQQTGADDHDLLLSSKKIKIGVIGNISFNLFGSTFKDVCVAHDLNIDLHEGTYDDPIGDTRRFQGKNVDYIFLFDFFDNLIPAFEGQALVMDPKNIDSLKKQTFNKYKIIFEEAKGAKGIFVCDYHLVSNMAESNFNNLTTEVVKEFSRELKALCNGYRNVFILDSNKVINALGHRSCFDLRFYYNFKSPYTENFFREISLQAIYLSKFLGQKYYKVLALDCDNTLWSGIAGEDLLNGIRLDPYSYPGNIFWMIQHQLSNLQKNGVILALVSKNNQGDVDEIFEKHPNMVINKKQISIEKINWNNKASNIFELANSLNLGLDSIVFLDDSPVECELVKRAFPEITVFQVPPKLSNYPLMIDQVSMLFSSHRPESLSENKTDQYKIRERAQELLNSSSSFDEFILALSLKVSMQINNLALTSRLVELSQKTNQFNLTNVRYTEYDMKYRIESQEYDVIALSVTDKFGDSGVTGVLVLRYENFTCFIENFYMSCRVLGREIENSFWGVLRPYLINRNVKKVAAKYVRSRRNSQVENFWESVGLSCTLDDSSMKDYSCDILVLSDFVDSRMEINNDFD